MYVLNDQILKNKVEARCLAGGCFVFFFCEEIFQHLFNYNYLYDMHFVKFDKINQGTIPGVVIYWSFIETYTFRHDSSDWKVDREMKPMQLEKRPSCHPMV